MVPKNNNMIQHIKFELTFTFLIVEIISYISFYLPILTKSLLNSILIKLSLSTL